MKTTEAKSTHSQQHQAAESAAWSQEQEQSFFSEPGAAPTPFFPSGVLPGIQAKGLSGTHPFFQPGGTLALQRKCAGCEAEETPESAPHVQRMPAFESDAEAPVIQPKRLLQRQVAPLEPEEEGSTEKSDLLEKVVSTGDPPDSGGDSRPYTAPFAQLKLTIGRPNDPFEQEADAVADQVTQPKRQESLAAGIQTKPLEKVISRLPAQPALAIPPKRLQSRPQIQKQGESDAIASDDVANRLSSRGGGSALDGNTRGEMESSFGADFSGVRIHTGSEAAQLSQDLGAKAFTHGSDIYFNQGQYDPGSSEGKHLLAHELTHTVQQGAAIQTKPKVMGDRTPDVQAGFFDDPLGSIASAAGSALDAGADLVGLSIDDLREMLADFVDDNIPVYSMMSVAIGYDVLRGRRVERTRENIIKGVFSLINPLGTILRKRLEERGIIKEAFDWIDGQLTSLGLTAGDIKAKLNQFLDGVTLATTSPIDDNIALFKRTFGSIFSSIATFIQNVGNEVYEMIKKAFLKLLGELARKIGGYDLLADLLGKDPITGEARNASTADILRGILKLPAIQAVGGDKLLKKLEELKLIDKTADWIDQQWAILEASFSNLLAIAEKFLSLFTLSVEVLTNPMKLVNEIKGEVISFVSNAIAFFKNLASKALEIIKEAMIWLVDKYVDKNSPAWDLAVFVLGKNPITGEKVPRSYLKLIGAFLKLLPGGEALYQKFIETGALQRMVGWIQGAVQKFIDILLGLKDAFVNLWKMVTIDALLDPVGFFTEVVDLFKKPVLQLVAFVKVVLIKIFEVLMDLMKLPKEIATEIITNVVKAYNDIRKDPIKFLLNLLKAVKQGFAQFFENIGKHLLKGVTGWLFGQLAKGGITIPQKLDMPSILELVLQVLNLTLDNLWARLAKRIGQDKVGKIKGAIDKLVGIWTFVTDVINNGISAIWTYIQSQISGLWDMILEKARNWIITTIIQKVTTKLLTMLDPTGIMAVINGFIAFYKAIESFIEKLNEMLQIAASFVKGVAEIARGTVGKAADYLENSLVSALPVALSFLANQIGLGGIGDKIKEIIQTVRGFIDKGIDWLIDKAIKAMKSIMGIFGGKKGSKKEDGKYTKEDKYTGLKAFEEEEKPFLEDGNITKKGAKQVAKIVKIKHPVFKQITIVDTKERWDYGYIFRSSNNLPTESTNSKKASTPPKGWKGRVAHALANRSQLGLNDPFTSQQWMDAFNTEFGDGFIRSLRVAQIDLKSAADDENIKLNVAERTPNGILYELGEFTSDGSTKREEIINRIKAIIQPFIDSANSISDGYVVSNDATHMKNKIDRSTELGKKVIKLGEGMKGKCRTCDMETEIEQTWVGDHVPALALLDIVEEFTGQAVLEHKVYPQSRENALKQGPYVRETRKFYNQYKELGKKSESESLTERESKEMESLKSIIQSRLDNEIVSGGEGEFITVGRGKKLNPSEKKKIQEIGNETYGHQGGLSPSEECIIDHNPPRAINKIILELQENHGIDFGFTSVKLVPSCRRHSDQQSRIRSKLNELRVLINLLTNT